MAHPIGKCGIGWAISHWSEVRWVKVKVKSGELESDGEVVIVNCPDVVPLSNKPPS